MNIARPEQLAETFVDLADTLVTDFDSTDLLHRLTEHCVEILGVNAAGLLLADPAESGSPLRLVASSTEQARVLELFQLQDEEGPSLECYRTGEVSTVTDVDQARQRWPRFANAAGELGFAGVHAVPMRLRERTIGSLSLFRTDPAELDATSARIARALADVSTIGLLQERALREQETLSEQLQTALGSRVNIEQAKGILAASLDLDVEQAFTVLRGYGRRHGRRLKDVSQAVIDGSLDADEMRSQARP